MFKKTVTLFLTFSSTLFFAQKIHKTERICFFQDGKTGRPITIVSDSLIYKGDLKNPTVLKHTQYPETLDLYSYHFTVNKHTYLIHDGGGVVLEYRNDSIVRIDNSFLHRNQFNSTPFTYNNQMYLFGGYGLFTYKNIITQYNFNSREWDELTTNSEETPTAREYADKLLIDNNLYVFGGQKINKKTKPSLFENDNALWKLDLETLNWSQLGTINPKYKYTIKNERKCLFQAKNKLYIFYIDVIFEIDFLNNVINYYDNKSGIDPFMLYYDTKTDTISALNTILATNEIKLNTIKLATLLNNNTPYKTETFYTPNSWFKQNAYSIAFILLFIISLVLFKILKKKRANYILYDNKTNLFTYKSNMIPSLGIMEEKFLIYLFQNQSEFIQLNALNIFYENGGNQENFNAIIKKRDVVLNSLFFKLQLILYIEKDEFILKQNNEIDNRIKEIKLNPTYFKIK